MPFLARCPACDQAQVCVLDPRSEPRLRCTRCRQYFTAGEPAAVSAAGEPAVTSHALRVQPEASPPAVAVLEPSATSPPPAAPVASPPARPARRVRPAAGRWAVPLTVAGLLLLAGGLLAAPFESLGVLVRPLAAASLMTGLLAVRSTHLAGGPLRYPIAVSATAAVVLLTGLAAPALLGPGYEAARESTGPDAAIRVVPLPAYAGLADQLGTEWVDGGKASLQQGRVRVEVAEAWVGPALKKDGRDSGSPWLYVRVRLHRARTGAEIAAGAFAQTLAWNDQARATVRDAAGTPFEQLPDRPPAAKAGGAGAAAGTSLDVTDEVLAFAAPPTFAAGVRLELPGAAWGGSGAFRFALPGDLIQDRSPRPAKSRGS